MTPPRPADPCPIVAIVPAAGRSARMGRPKLILPIDGVAVIARVVRALLGGGADRVLVVAPPREAPGAAELIARAEEAGAVVAIAEAPTADMRASVQRGIDALLAGGHAPAAILLAPGDSPVLAPATVARVIARSRAGSPSIVVPTFDGRRGHPLLLPWGVATGIRDLPPGVGVNALLAGRVREVVELPVDDPGAVIDLDTPEEYRRLAGAGGEFLRIDGGAPSGGGAVRLD